jgi:hypothetical protein
MSLENITKQLVIINDGDGAQWEQHGDFAAAAMPNANALTAATIVNYPKIRLAHLRNNDPLLPNERAIEIEGWGIIYSCKNGYQAPLKHRVRILDADHPSDPVFLTTRYTLRVIGEMNPHYTGESGLPINGFYTIISSPTVPMTVAALHAAFVVMINADPIVSRFILATVVAGDLILEAKSPYFTKREALRFTANIEIEGSITNLKANIFAGAGYGVGNLGSGSYELVHNMERELRAWRNDIWLEHTADTTYAYHAKPGATYDVFCIQHGKRQFNVATGNQISNVIELYICIENSPVDTETALQAVIEDPLNAYLIEHHHQIETFSQPSNTPIDAPVAPVQDI